MNETYHSTKGAITESKYVFLKNGLKYYRSLNPEKESIRILEVGFGTGLNAWLTAIEGQGSSDPAHRLNIQYCALEKFPLEGATISQLNYPTMDSDKDMHGLFDRIHACKWEKYQSINECFELKKCQSDVHDFIDENASFDLVYFDAFAPSKQPDIWDISIFIKMFRLLATRGVLVTYCAQGQFKRDLRSVGFDVETLEGPPGKKEMTRGVKI